jgi:hypothetical protein
MNNNKIISCQNNKNSTRDFTKRKYFKIKNYSIKITTQIKLFQTSIKIDLKKKVKAPHYIKIYILLYLFYFSVFRENIVKKF